MADVTAGPQGPALTGTDDEALAQALRNLWPILSPAGPLTGSDHDALLQALRNLWPILGTTGRRQAINASKLKGQQ